MRNRTAVLIASLMVVAACGENSTLPVKAGMGPDPELPAPRSSMLPTVHVAPATGWAPGETPSAAPGLTVNAYSGGLDHPRWLHVLPNGDVLVAESNAPAKPDDGKGIRGWVMKKMMARAGAGVPTANRITLLRDGDGDGVVETRSVFLENLNSPFGMALVGDRLYVANTDAVMQFPYESGATKIAAAGTRIVDLPAGTLNHHWTKNLIAGPDGKHLYVTVGSNSNVGENGMDKEERRAAILEIDIAAGTSRVFASGMRNPNGMDWEPRSGMLWTTVNERDEIGGDLVPDYMTSVKEGGFYGWPWSYFGAHVDERVQPPRPDRVVMAIKPDYALGAHTGSLGLIFSRGELLPEKYREGVFIGQHGSWNRKPRSGYKVIFIPFADGRPAGDAQDVLVDFVDADGKARGRPVGVAIDKVGALLVADDVGNVVWRVGPSPAASR